MYKIKFSLFTLFFTLMVSTLWADVEINEKNFPDNDFRNFLLHQSYGKDKILTEAEIASITEISVGGENYDGVKNMKGIEFFFALEKLDCCECCVSELDVSKNTALTYLDCDDNLLTELDVSNNTALTYIDCSRNKLIALELPKNATFTWLDCSYNQIKGMAMDDLIESLPSISKGTMRVIGRGSEKNVMTKRQVADAKAKGWVPQYDDDDYWRDYAGNKDYEIFSGGNGTEANPYIINTPSDFNMLAEEVNSGNTCEGRYFKVEVPSIDFSGENYFIIGAASTQFKGIFDGNNVEIKNLAISDYFNSSGIGLFGYIGRNGCVSGIVLDSSCSIYSTGGNAAGIAGLNTGTISNCINKASITARYHVGGICGDCMGSIINCKNYGEISMYDSPSSGIMGGIAGDLDKGEILNCENYGNINGSSNSFQIGGIVGLVCERNNIIDGCLNKGNVIGNHSVGGLLGWATGSIDIKISNNLVTGCQIIGTQEDGDVYVGAIGYSGSGEKLSNNFYTLDVVVKAGNTIYDGFKARAYVNRGNRWNYPENNGGMPQIAIEDYFTSYAENSYEIKSINDLYFFKDLVTEVGVSFEGMNFKVTAKELDFKNFSLFIGQYCKWDANNYNQPTYKPFSGVFDGNGVVVKNLYNINYSNDSESCYGLFSYNKGTIKNIILDESCRINSIQSGGIVGFNDGTISGCTNKGSYNVGGIAYRNSGTIKNNFVYGMRPAQGISGAIVRFNEGILENNFYRYEKYDFNVDGTFNGDISENFGAIKVFTISTSEKTEILNRATNGPGIVTIDDLTYYANGLTVNVDLNYTDEVPNGYEVVYSDKGTLTPNEDGTYTITIDAKDVVIKGNVTPRLYKLTYYVDGEEYRSQDYHYTDAIRPLPEPQKYGYTFSGWSEIPDTMPAHDVKVTGTFTFTGKLNNLEISGIYYNVDATTKEAEVCRNQNLYSGDIVIPSSVQFEGSTYSVTSIAAASFWGCMGLTSIEIPNSVAAIGNNAFYGCSNLKSIVSKIQVPFTYNNAFDGLSYNCVLTVPDGTKSAYFAAGWTNDVFKGGVVESSESSEEIIDFADANVKAICVSKWDTNKDGELSVREAAVVSDLGEVFTGKTEITSFNEFKYFTSLTKINSFVFENCSGLTSITIPHNVTSLGSGSFRNCTGLKSILIPNNVTSIEARAFYGCTSLSSITVAEDNPVYDSRDNCNAIIETQSNTLISGCINTIILNGVTSIGASAFGGCSGLTSIEIPNSVYSIGEYAFSGSGLTSIEIPNGVTSIGNNAFQDCSGLTSIEISNSVTSIGDFAFAECSGLTSIKIPEGVTSIGTYAFGYCYLTSIEISSSVTSIGEWAFGDCDDIISISVAEGNPVYDSRDNCNAIIETKSNTLILGCRNTVIPNSVLSIGKFGFQSCNLSHIDIPQSITTIGDYAFRGNAFTILTIPENVTSIGEEAFSYNENLKEVYCNAPKVPETSNNAFSSGVDLSTVTLYLPEEELVALYKAQAPWKNFGKIVAVQGTEPTSPIIFADTRVKAVCVANWDADGNGKLSMAEAAAVTDLGTAFKGNTAITSFKELKFFTGLTKISAHAFGGCKGLTSVEIPNNVTSIDEGAFYGSGLTSIFIPDSVSHIGSGAFSYCRNLLNLVVDENNPVYDSRDDSNALIETSTNTLVHATGNSVVPNSITRIGDGAFVDYTIKTTLEIPEGVTHIGQNVFPSTLSSLVSKMKVPVRYDSFFENVPYNCSLSIPFGTSAVYIAAGWTEDIFKGGIKESGDIIFADANVKALCVANWDKNGDGELSVAEAEVVRNLGTVFANNKDIKSFNELKYFTGLELIAKHVFSGCTNLSYIKLPNNLTTIGESAFSGCKGLMYIDLPNSVNTIGNGAFNECASLTYIVLPEQVKSVGSYAFAGCKKLMDVYCYATSVPATGRDPFPNVSTATLHVPEVSIDEYRAANFWSNFYKIVPIEPIFTLLYMIDDNVYMSYKVEEGTAIIPLDMPSKEGYTFEWKELPDVMPAHDVTVYGSYSINKYKLIYMVNDTEYKTIEAEYGSAITPESEPIKEGYIFSGWSEIPDTMPAHDVTVTGTLTRYYIVGDVPKVVNFIMNSNATPDDIALYDVNNDSELDIGDVILIVRYLLDNGGSTLNRVTKRRAPGISDITQYTAAQFNLVVDKNTTIKSIRLVGSMKQTHQLMCKQIDETTYSVVVFSLSNQLLNPESGSIVTVETDGEDVNIQNMIVATSSGESYYYQNDDVITNIFPLTNSNKSKECYDLKGYRVNESNLKKGSIVIYGKKVLVK